MSLPEHLSTLFDQALEISGEKERNAFVHSQCADDDALRADLEKMLRVHAKASGYFSRPPRIRTASTGENVGRESVIGRLTQQFDLPDTGDAGQTTQHAYGQSVGRYQLQGEIARGGMARL